MEKLIKIYQEEQYKYEKSTKTYESNLQEITKKKLQLEVVENELSFIKQQNTYIS